MNKRNANIFIIIVIFTVGILAALAAAVPPPANYDTDRILDAIRLQETGGHKDPANARGDGGRALGPFQIHRAYWQDAVDHDPSIGGRYEDVRDEQYARRIVLAYLSRYCPKWTDENVARIHNGGGGILKKKNSKSAANRRAWDNTTRYWNEIKSKLD